MIHRSIPPILWATCCWNNILLSGRPSVCCCSPSPDINTFWFFNFDFCSLTELWVYEMLPVCYFALLAMSKQILNGIFNKSSKRYAVPGNPRHPASHCLRVDGSFLVIVPLNGLINTASVPSLPTMAHAFSINSRPEQSPSGIHSFTMAGVQ